MYRILGTEVPCASAASGAARRPPARMPRNARRSNPSPRGASLRLLIALQTLAHESLALIALEGLGRCVRVALLHLVLLGHRCSGGASLQTARHEGLPLVAFLVTGLGVACLHLLLLGGELLVIRGRGSTVGGGHEGHLRER